MKMKFQMKNDGAFFMANVPGFNNEHNFCAVCSSSFLQVTNGAFPNGVIVELAKQNPKKKGWRKIFASMRTGDGYHLSLWVNGSDFSSTYGLCRLLKNHFAFPLSVDSKTPIYFKLTAVS